MPDVLLDRLCELYGKEKTNQSHAKSEETKRQTALLDHFLDTYEVATTGDWFNKDKQWYRPIECPWSNLHENPNEGTSTCIVYTEGSGYGFDCKHRCANKGWQEFRAELERRHPNRKFSFASGEVVTAVAKEGVPPDETPLGEKDWRSLFHSLQPQPQFLHRRNHKTSQERDD